MVVHLINEAVLRLAEAPFHAIEAISVPWLDSILPGVYVGSSRIISTAAP
jgi:hypothetical protein